MLAAYSNLILITASAITLVMFIVLLAMANTYRRLFEKYQKVKLSEIEIEQRIKKETEEILEEARGEWLGIIREAHKKATRIVEEADIFVDELRADISKVSEKAFEQESKKLFFDLEKKNLVLQKRLEAEFEENLKNIIANLQKEFEDKKQTVFNSLADFESIQKQNIENMIKLQAENLIKQSLSEAVSQNVKEEIIKNALKLAVEKLK